ncbi:hypothetical protein V5O48_009291 [Marasmius crinis-equi]|uniref:F-box domain-containing protein n=1 Tax=Marasmius crinis-equi TaxID=585013 RepID=A0ABR3FBQ3_9AGAR
MAYYYYGFDQVAQCDSCKFTPNFRYEAVTRDRFRSEYSLPDATRSQMASWVEDEEKDVERYALEIARVKGILWKLEEEKQELEEKIRQRRCFLSIVRRVPGDIWVDIFGHCVRDAHRDITLQPDLKDEAHRGRYQLCFATPYRLSAICSLWRDLVVSSPRMWSYVALDLHRRGMFSGLILPALALSIERSKDRALEIVIGNTKNYEIINSLTIADLEHRRDSNALRAIQMLLDCLPRARVLVIDLGYADQNPMSHLEHTRDASFPRLEYLRIGGRFDSSSLGEALWRAPKLSTASFTSTSPLARLAHSSALQALEVEKVTGDDDLRNFLQILNTLPNFNSLIIHDCYHVETIIKPPVVYRGLRRLSLGVSEHEIHLVQPFLESIECPELQHLNLAFHYSPRIEPLGHGLERALPRFSSSLTHLSLSIHIESPPYLLPRILRALPNVVVFEAHLAHHIDWQYRDDPADALASELFAELSDDPAATSQLKSLLFVIESTRGTINTVTLEQIMRMIQIRVARTRDTSTGIAARGRTRSLTDMCVAVSLEDRLSLEAYNVRNRSQVLGIRCMLTRSASSRTYQLRLICGRYPESEVIEKGSQDRLPQRFSLV